MNHIKNFKRFEQAEWISETEDIEEEIEKDDEDVEQTTDEGDEEMDIDYDKNEPEETSKPLHSEPTRKHTQEPKEHEPYLGADPVKTFRRLRGFHY